jgi:hypothetical protein
MAVLLWRSRHVSQNQKFCERVAAPETVCGIMAALPAANATVRLCKHSGPKREPVIGGRDEEVPILRGD